jgi:hypothetical protein
MDWRNTVIPPGTLPVNFDPRQVHNCLIMSVSDCYTDFHMDFGGSSVWYHLTKVRISCQINLPYLIFLVFEGRESLLLDTANSAEQSHVPAMAQLF